MIILYGILLCIAYFLVGWIIIEIPLAAFRNHLNKRQGIDPNIPPSLQTIERVVIFQVVVLSLLAHLVGIQTSVILIAAFLRFMILAVLKG